MNILHVSPAYYPATKWGGPVFATYGLNQALAKLSGMYIKVLTTDSVGPRVSGRITESSGSTFLAPSHEVFYCKKLLLDSVSLEFIRRLPQLVRWADVVHLTFTYSFPTIPTIVACRAAGKPIVWSPRGGLQFAHQWKDARRQYMKRAWERICDAVLDERMSALHVTAKDEAEASTARIRRAAPEIIPNGVTVPSITEGDLRKAGPVLRLMYMGRIAPIKGIENLVDAVAQLHDIDVSLQIYGQGDDGYTDTLRSRTVQLGLSQRVFFRGHVDGPAKLAAFREADICVVPSHHENFCNVVVESLSCARPVVVSKGAPWPTIEEKQCGIWVENSARHLANAIRRMSKLDLADMGDRGRRWVAAEYSWDSVAERMYALYQRLIEKRKSSCRRS